jgi:hypothetical protein
MRLIYFKNKNYLEFLKKMKFYFYKESKKNKIIFYPSTSLIISLHCADYRSRKHLPPVN